MKYFIFLVGTNLLLFCSFRILGKKYKQTQSIIMDSLPPNDPNNNRNSSGRQNAKEIPHDGRNRRGVNANGEMELFGDLQDSPVVVMMFLVGVASWFLRERCVC